MFRIEHDAETGEIKEINLSDKEKADFEALYAKNQIAIAEIEKSIAEQKAKRSALLEKLGITDEEARLLLG